MMINVGADKLADSTGAPQPSELLHKSGRTPSQTDNSTVDVDHEGMWPVYLASGHQPNIWVPMG